MLKQSKLIRYILFAKQPTMSSHNFSGLQWYQGTHTFPLNHVIYRPTIGVDIVQ